MFLDLKTFFFHYTPPSEAQFGIITDISLFRILLKKLSKSGELLAGLGLPKVRKNPKNREKFHFFTGLRHTHTINGLYS